MNIQLIIKGFIVGIGKIIPGVSGSMLAISMGIYEKALDCISHFFRHIKENIFFLGNLCAGILFAILLFSHIIHWSLENYYFEVMLLFIGLILGTMPSVYGTIKGQKRTIYRIFLFLLATTFVFLLTLVKNNNVSIQQNTNLHFILIGLIDAITMIIPGISGTAVLMILGYYDLFIKLFVEFSLVSTIFFGIGLMIGVISVSKIMGYFLSKHKASTYYVILGFSLSSLLVLLINTLKTPHTLFSLIIGIILIILGYFLSSSLNRD